MGLRRFSQIRWQRRSTIWLLACCTAWAWNYRHVPLVDAAEPAKPATPVALNSIGYLPWAPKFATVSGRGTAFEVRDSMSHEVVLHGTLAPVDKSIANDDTATIADFSALQRTGRYRISVAGVGESAEFRISADLFNWPFYCVMKAMYLTRCGCSVDAQLGGVTYRHAPCHLEDAFLDFAGGHPGARKDGVGGWHDAGDYNKYTTNGAFTVGMLLQTWEHFGERLKSLTLDLPESSNSTPDFLDEVRWEVEWLLKMQAPDGRVYHKLSTRTFGGFVLPEAETTPRYFSPWGTAATASVTAVAAQSSRVFRPFDVAFADRCFAAAKNGYAALETNPQEQAPDLSMFSTGQYGSSDVDDRVWAAAEMWETTADAKYLRDFESRILKLPPRQRRLPANVVASDWDWRDLRNLATFTYVLSKRPGRDPELLKHLQEAIVHGSDEIVEVAHRHPYERSLGEKYYWGCNGTLVRQAMNLHVARLLTGNEQYDIAILSSLNHVFGRNPFGRSFVTGLGHCPPTAPHDRRLGQPTNRNPWPGYLVGGPWPTARDWYDDREDFRTNEIAINWNGALIYALAGFVRAEEFGQSIADAKNAMPATSQGK